MSKYSTFHIHGITIGLNNWFTKATLQEQLSSLNELENDLIQIYIDNTDFGNKEIIKYFTYGKRIDSSVSITKKLVHKIKGFKMPKNCAILSYFQTA